MPKPFEAVVPDAYRTAYDTFQFAPAVRAGDQIHVSGVIGLGPDMTLPDSFAEQAQNVFAALEMILAEAGASLADVFSITSYHVGDLDAQMGVFIPIKTERLGTPHTAWTAVGITRLALGALLEVSAIARAR